MKVERSVSPEKSTVLGHRKTSVAGWLGGERAKL